MNILITSIVDLKKTPHSRLHQFIKYLLKSNDITVVCINDWWKSSQTNAALYTKGLDEIVDNVELIYLTNRKISPIFQEVCSYKTLRDLDLDKFDVHLNYNTLISGYFVAKKAKSTIYDIADDLPKMIRHSLQIPFFLRPFAALLGDYMLKANVARSKRITYITTSLKNSYNLPDIKSTKVPNGVDTELFKKHPSNHLKKRLNLNGEFVVGYVGVLREWIDLDPVFRAMRALIDENLRIKLLVAGEEGLFKQNKDLVKKYGITDNVIFTGTIPYLEVPTYISCMDACLVPFKNDAMSNNSLPLKLFEYMSCEKPVISARLRGVIENVANRVLYASRAEEYKSTIIKLYRDESLRRALGIEGREFVMKNFDWDMIGSKLENILKEAAN